MKRVAVIPSYEPDEYLGLTVGKILENGMEAVVIDDGSGPEYASFFDALPPQVHKISYETNQGKGYALKQGFSYIAQHFGEDCAVVTVDSDGQHGIKDVVRVLEEAEKAPGSLVLGSRYLGKSAPFRSRLGNGITRWLCRLATCNPVYDTQTGLRGITGNLLEGFCRIPGNRYEYEIRSLLECAGSRIPIREIRIQTIYLDENSRSHFRPIRDSLRLYRQIFKYAAPAIAGFLAEMLLFWGLLLCTAALPPVAGLVLANVAAEGLRLCIPGLFRKNVFKKKASAGSAFAELLLVGISTLLLCLLVSFLSLNPLAAKLILFAAFFLLRYCISAVVAKISKNS